MMKFEHSGISLSLNAWLAAIFLVICLFNYYYLSLYPRLNGQYQDGFWNSEYAVLVKDQNTSQKDENTITGLKFKIKYPRYLTSYDYGDLEITVINETSGELSGYLSVVGDVFKPNSSLSSHNILLAPIKDGTIGSSVYNYSIRYVLQPQTSEVYVIKVKAPSIDSSLHELVSFRFSNRPTSGAHVNVTSVTSESATQNSCKPYLEELDEFRNIDEKYSVLFCAEINSIEVFRQSVIEKLLLPPWSNVLLPFVGAGFVWFVEIHLEDKRRRSAITLQDLFGLEGFVNVLAPSFILIWLVQWVLWTVLLPTDRFTAFNEVHPRLLILLPLIVLFLPPITSRLLTITTFLNGILFHFFRKILVKLEGTLVRESKSSALDKRIRHSWNTSDYQALQETKNEVDKMLDDPPLRSRLKVLLLGTNSEAEELREKQNLLNKRLPSLEEKLNDQLERIRELINTDISMPKFWENYRSAYELACKCPYYFSNGSWLYEEQVHKNSVILQISRTLDERSRERLASIRDENKRLEFLNEIITQVEHLLGVGDKSFFVYKKETGYIDDIESAKKIIIDLQECLNKERETLKRKLEPEQDKSNDITSEDSVPRNIQDLLSS